MSTSTTGKRGDFAAEPGISAAAAPAGDSTAAFNPRQSLLWLGFILIWLSYVYWVGGDCFPLGRFFIMVIPLMDVCAALLPFELWRLGGRGKGWVWRGVALVAGGLAAYQLVAFPVDATVRILRERIINVGSIGTYNAIKEAKIPDGTLIAVVRAGTLPYLLPNMRFHDLIGKSDRFIAHTQSKWGPPGHSKWDYEYSLGVIKPAVLITADSYDRYNEAKLAKLLREKADYGFFPALWFDPNFRTHYLPNRVPNPDKSPSNQWIFLYR